MFRYIFFTFQMLIFFVHAYADKPMTYVFTYPRSGTHWFMHCLSFIATDQKTGKHFLHKSRGFSNFHSFEIFNEISQTTGRKFIDFEKDYIILIIRDYKESMLRHFDGNDQTVISHIKDDSNFPKQLRFFSNLEHFDKWPKDRKLLIYYEDFLTSPKTQLIRLIDFLSIENTNLEPLLSSLDKQKKICIDHYNLEHKKRNLPGVGSRSGGVLRWHQCQIPYETLKKIETTAKERNPALYEKYLKRYEYDL